MHSNTKTTKPEKLTVLTPSAEWNEFPEHSGEIWHESSPKEPNKAFKLLSQH